jgi:ABC-type xylose transport system permease subunit
LIVATRLNTARPKPGNGFELGVIAVCFLGGASASGGVGTVTGAVVGALACCFQMRRPLFWIYTLFLFQPVVNDGILWVGMYFTGFERTIM